MPSLKYGKGGPSQQEVNDQKEQFTKAFQVMRSDPALATLAPAKPMRTVLSSQPRLVRRILSAQNTPARSQLFISGMKRAGLDALLNIHVSPGETAQTSKPQAQPTSRPERAPNKMASPPPDPVSVTTAPGVSGRWGRRGKVSETDSGRCA